MEERFPACPTVGHLFRGDLDARELSLTPIAGTQVIDFAPSVLLAQETPLPRELAALDPVASWVDEDGRLVFDFGQNVAGYVRTVFRGQSGAEVLIEYSEVLGPDRFSTIETTAAPSLRIATH